MAVGPRAGDVFPPCKRGSLGGSVTAGGLARSGWGCSPEGSLFRGEGDLSGSATGGLVRVVVLFRGGVVPVQRGVWVRGGGPSVRDGVGCSSPDGGPVYPCRGKTLGFPPAGAAPVTPWRWCSPGGEHVFPRAAREDLGSSPTTEPLASAMAAGCSSPDGGHVVPCRREDLSGGFLYNERPSLGHAGVGCSAGRGEQLSGPPCSEGDLIGGSSHYGGTLARLNAWRWMLWPDGGDLVPPCSEGRSRGLLYNGGLARLNARGFPGGESIPPSGEGSLSEDFRCGGDVAGGCV